MIRKEIATGVVHTVPTDLRKVLLADDKARAAWNAITPLARNEWICWIESVKKTETRNYHIQRARAELKLGKHRPCCWAGCIHRSKKSKQ